MVLRQAIGGIKATGSVQGKHRGGLGIGPIDQIGGVSAGVAVQAIADDCVDHQVGSDGFCADRHPAIAARADQNDRGRGSELAHRYVRECAACVLHHPDQVDSILVERRPEEGSGV